MMLNRQQRRVLPKFWRPPLPQSAKLDSKIVHWDLVNRISSGDANTEDLWDWIETGFTYSQIMHLLAEDGIVFSQDAIDAIAGQINIYEDVVGRYRRMGRVGFSGPELQAARAAALVMDGLIDMDRHGIADQAAHWSINTMRRIRLGVYKEIRG